MISTPLSAIRNAGAVFDCGRKTRCWSSGFSLRRLTVVANFCRPPEHPAANEIKVNPGKLSNPK
jgi:hypothetical protein